VQLHRDVLCGGYISFGYSGFNAGKIICRVIKMDQGILALMNEAQPGCEVNQDYARWAQETGKVKSVPKNQQCPVGYEMLATTNKLYSNSLYDTCKLINMTETDVPQALLTRINACIYGTPSPSGPSPSKGFPGWAIALIVILAILLLGGIGLAMSKSK